jgi:hypothetical protein
MMVSLSRRNCTRLPDLGVNVLNLKYQRSSRRCEFGNQFRFKAKVNSGSARDRRDEASGVGRWTYDVFWITN